MVFDSWDLLIEQEPNPNRCAAAGSLCLCWCPIAVCDIVVLMFNSVALVSNRQER